MKIAFTSSYLCEGRDLPESEKTIIREFQKRRAKVVVFDVTKVNYLLNHHVEIYAGKDSLHDADILFIRRARHAERESFQLATLMEKLGKTVIDNAEAFRYPIQKLLTDAHVYKYLYYPKTCHLNSLENAEFYLKKMGLSFPMVIKPQASTMGRGVTILKNLGHLKRYPKKHQEHGVIVQELIEPVYEYRVLTVGHKALGAVKKKHHLFYRKKNTNAFTFERNKAVEDFALGAVSHLPADIYGVDVLETADGDFHILEANRNPTFTNFKRHSGIDVEKKLVDFSLQKHRS